MKIEESYLAVSGCFDLWVRFMEIRTRIMEVEDSRLNNLRILIISPPTDRGIRVLTQANQKGESHLLCFSEALGKIATEYSLRYNIKNLKIWVEPFFSIPFDDNHFDAVFTNCFFDFCQESDFNDILKEIKRTLKSEGLFFSVYMDIPTDIIGRTWANLFYKFQSLSQGCHPVDILPFLSKWNFKLKKELTIKRLGFPVKYLIAEK
ncbi:MAG: methyltransferase domain-containing protein [Calditrichaeota bacterium]|nr:MAG: methyltransferase domain-containing protein [Calditrichota bacterium]